MKSGFILIPIILIAVILRFWLLGNVPTGVTHDEMGYIYNAYSIAKTGRNVFGEFLPVFTWMTKSGFPFMPVPVYSMVPLFWFLPLTAFTGRLLPAILGVADVVLLYFIVLNLFRHPALALVSALFLAISPWQIHFARSAYDANYALFYFLAATAAFVSAIRKKKLSRAVIPAFLLAVFSYRGMSVILVPLGVAFLWYARITRALSLRQGVIFLAGIGISVLLFASPIFVYGNTFVAEGTQLFKNAKIQEDVDASIREAQGPLAVRRFFANKPTYIIDRFRENYIKTYSPEFLFLYTEPSAIYSIWSRGRLYFIDVFFIIAGIAYLYRIRKQAAILWYGLLLIGGLPGGIGGMPYSARNLFLAAVFPVFSAAGVLFAVGSPRHKVLRLGVLSVVVMLYTYALGSYVYDYYLRYAFQGAEGWAKSIREISVLTRNKQPSSDLVVLGKTSFGDTVQFAFWNALDPDLVQKTWENRKMQPFTYFPIENAIFSEKCLDKKDLRDPMFQNVSTIYYITVHTCNNEATPSGKIEDYFGNPIWKLFELDRSNPDSYSTL